MAHRLADDHRLVDVEHVGRLAFPRRTDLALDAVCEIEGHELDATTLTARPTLVERSLWVPVKLHAGSVEADELHPGSMSLVVRFLAMTGTYATMVIRQLVEPADDA